MYSYCYIFFYPGLFDKTHIESLYSAITSFTFNIWYVVCVLELFWISLIVIFSVYMWMCLKIFFMWVYINIYIYKILFLVKDFLTNYISITSNFYGLPKIHKSKQIKSTIEIQKSKYIEIPNPKSQWPEI